MTANGPRKIEHLAASCRCGKVIFEAAGAPILATSCYCTSCQQAGRAFEKATGPFLDADGGTPVVLYRKDRVRCRTGKEYLREFRLKPESPTRRVLATCCSSPMFGDFTKGHWLSLYRSRLADGAPPIEMRIMTRERRADVMLPNDVPNYEGFSGRFLLKLMRSWIAMGFRKPDMGLGDIPGING